MDAQHISSLVNSSIIVLFALTWFGIILFLRLKKKKTVIYLTFFTIFYIYLFKVLDYTLFQFQSLLILKHFIPNLILNGVEAGKSINITPFITLTPQDIKTSLLNILMLILFGFGLPFIANLRMKQVVITGALFSIAIELLQLATGLLGNTTFRIADINDVVFNTLGVVIGYILFARFVRIVRHMAHRWGISDNQFTQYITKRSQVGK